MITANINNGKVVISAVGNDIEELTALSGSFDINNLGTSLNPKTGRKHYVVILEPSDGSGEEVEALKKEIKSLKSSNTKLKKEIKDLQTPPEENAE